MKKKTNIIGTNKEKEIWIDIINYEGIYQVSNLGKIKSLKRTCSSRNNSIRKVSDKLLKIFPNKTRANYWYVSLASNKPKQYRVHKLVALHFIPNPDNLPQINHIDGNKANNMVYNLEWCTAQQNTDHAFKLGLMPDRRNNNASNKKLTKEIVAIIQIELAKGVKNRILAKKYSVSDATISLIKHNKRWEK